VNSATAPDTRPFGEPSLLILDWACCSPSDPRGGRVQRPVSAPPRCSGTSTWIPPGATPLCSRTRSSPATSSSSPAAGPCATRPSTATSPPRSGPSSRSTSSSGASLSATASAPTAPPASTSTPASAARTSASTPADAAARGVVRCEPAEIVDHALLRGAVGIGHEGPVRGLALDGAFSTPVGDQHLPGVGQQFRHNVEHSMAPSSVRHCCILGSWVGSAYMRGQS
jgi:hypothetical protein